jgi:hypothetical protein
VVTVSDPSWPHEHPTGRAHLRLLWREKARGGGPVLWFEGTHVDFRAANLLDTRAYTPLVLRHAMLKSHRMGVPLSADAYDAEALRAILRQLERESSPVAGAVAIVTEAVVLRPSNGVVEASDYISSKHDWVQLETETTQPLRRAHFTPAMA